MMSDDASQVESPNPTRAEYEELSERIATGNKLIIAWKRKRSDKTDIGYEPEFVSVATPSKFLGFSEANLKELVRI